MGGRDEDDFELRRPVLPRTAFLLSLSLEIAERRASLLERNNSWKFGVLGL